MKTAPTKAVHTPTAALKEGQTGLGILSAFQLRRNRLEQAGVAARHAYGWAERSGTRRELPLSFEATDSSQKVAAGGEDRCDGPLYQGRSSGNRSATARKPLTSTMATTKNMTMTNSPRIIGSLGHSRSRPHSGKSRKLCLRTSEHRNKIPDQSKNVPGSQCVSANTVTREGDLERRSVDLSSFAQAFHSSQLF